jgi:tetratricopeptide (TPR) repeat protein
MHKEETIQQIKDMLGRSESRDVIEHCDHIIEKQDNEEDKKFVAQLFYMRGNAYRQLGDWGKAMSSYLEASERDPDGPAKQAYAHALEILDFYNHDLYNP